MRSINHRCISARPSGIITFAAPLAEQRDSPRTECIWTSQTTPSLSLPTKMLSIGLTVGTPFAMRRKPTLAKTNKFFYRVFLSPCPSTQPSANGHLPLPPCVAAYRSVFFSLVLRPTMVLKRYRGWELLPHPCPFARPFTCLSWCRRQCCLRSMPPSSFRLDPHQANMVMHKLPPPTTAAPHRSQCSFTACLVRGQLLQPSVHFFFELCLSRRREKLHFFCWCNK